MPAKHALILLTRPLEGSKRFAEALTKASGADLNVAIAPLMAIEYLNDPIGNDFDVAVFTSTHGVSGFARGARGAGRTAFCVGDRTAECAENAGFAAVSAKGGAVALIALIQKHRPPGRIRHFRGQQIHQSIVGSLSDFEIPVTEQIIYRQIQQNFDESTLYLLANAADIKVPLFSRESAQQFDRQEIVGTTCDIFCISQATLSGLSPEKYRKTTVIPDPTQNSMIKAVLAGN